MDDLFQTISNIQRKVYNHFTYQTDQEQYGTIERWVMPSEAYTGSTAIVGDCEDFALACRKLCREAGLPTRLIFCAVDGEGHCVLECNGWIFDCNYDSIKNRDELNYTWMYISDFEPTGKWFKIIDES